MSHPRVDARVPADRPQVTPPKHPRARMAPHSLVQMLLLALLLLAEIVGSWSFVATPADAASATPYAGIPASLTFQQFLRQGRHDRFYHGPYVRPASFPRPAHAHFTDQSKLPPSSVKCGQGFSINSGFGTARSAGSWMVG